jgi:hypothetical protein
MIGYEIGEVPVKVNKEYTVAVAPFKDLRPDEERKGHSGKFLAFASKDSDFKELPEISITNLFKNELREAGVATKETGTADYRISAEILHFQTMVKLPGTMIIPYLGTVATLWESDRYVTVVTIRATMVKTDDEEVIFDRSFNISEDLRLKTGILNLERWFGRGMDYQFKRLNVGLADVLGQIRNEIIKHLSI